MKIEIEVDEMKLEDSFAEFIADTDSVSEIICALLFRLKKAREEADNYRARWEECAQGWNRERAARQAAEQTLSERLAAEAAEVAAMERCATP